MSALRVLILICHMFFADTMHDLAISTATPLHELTQASNMVGNVKIMEYLSNPQMSKVDGLNKVAQNQKPVERKRFKAGEVFVVTENYDKIDLRNWFNAQSKMMSRAISANGNPFVDLRFHGNVKQTIPDVLHEIFKHTQSILETKINLPYVHEIIKSTWFTWVFYKNSRRGATPTRNQWLRGQKIEFAKYPQFRRIFREKKLCLANKSVTDFDDYYGPSRDSNRDVYHEVHTEYSRISNAAIKGLFRLPLFYSFLKNKADANSIVNLGIRSFLNPLVAALNRMCDERERRIISMLKRKYDELMGVASENGLLDPLNTRAFNPNDFSAYQTMLNFNAHRRRSFESIARSVIARDMKWALNLYKWFNLRIATFKPNPPMQT